MVSQSDKTDRGIYITLGVLVGAVAGMAAGLLTAPKSGKETRDELRLRAKQSKEIAKQQLAAARDTTAEKLHKVLDKSKDAADSAKQTADRITDQVATTARKAKTETNRLQSTNA